MAGKEPEEAARMLVAPSLCYTPKDESMGISGDCVSQGLGLCKKRDLIHLGVLCVCVKVYG